MSKVAALGDAHLGRSYLPVTENGVNQRELDFERSFEAAVDLLVGDPPVAAGIGRAGRRHAEERYRWDTVLSRYERQLEHLVGRGSRRPLQPTR